LIIDVLLVIFALFSEHLLAFLKTLILLIGV
jgi:hypothetical protein